MNKFNSVFLAIKEECDRQKGLAEIDCFDKIALKTGISADKLPMYLSYLQDMGLIKYSIADRFIHLTSFGRKQETLVKDEK